MVGTKLYFNNGYVYTEADHCQQPIVSGRLRNGHVKVRVEMFEYVLQYRSLIRDSSSSSSSSSSSLRFPQWCYRQCEVVFDAPFNDLLRLHEMPPDSLVMINVKGAMESLGNLHPVVKRGIMSLIQRECNVIQRDRPVRPLSPFSSMETVISIFALVTTLKLDQ